MPFTLEVITPDRVVMREPVDFIQLRGEDGEIGVLPGHTPLFTALKSDVMVVKLGQGEDIVALMGGFMEVRPDQVTILSPAAERATEIDELRAREARQRAELVVDRERTAEGEAALSRALVRLRAVELLGGLRNARRHPPSQIR